MFRDCKCSVTIPHGVVGWSAVCDCGISFPGCDAKQSQTMLAGKNAMINVC